MAKTRKKILAIRLSAMGDVAMTVPVLTSLAKQCDVEITMLTTKAYAPMFSNIPHLSVFPFEKNGKHKGFWGLVRLFRELNKTEFDYIADLHNVLRTEILRKFFAFSPGIVGVVNKGRDEKRDLVTLGINKPLKHSIQRYKELFEEFGFNFKLEFDSIFDSEQALPESMQEAFGKKDKKWIGIAPFAKHMGKIYPLEKMEKVIGLLDQKNEYKIFLFGNGEEEMKTLTKWTTKYPSTQLMPEGVRLPQELILMSHLDLMVSMDSANMHLASLVGLPVVSIWGATHHFAGFLGWKQSEKNIVEVKLSCRPCSIFGNVPCKRKDYACLNWIKPHHVVEKIESNF